MFFAGLQFGHVVDQVDVHVLDDVRFLVIGHPQVYHVVRGRRCTTATAALVVVVFRVLLLLMVLMLLMLQLLVFQLLLLDDRAVLYVLLDLRGHERSQAPRLGRRHELYATTDRGPTSAGLQHAAAATRGAVLLHQIVAGLQQLLLVLQVQLVRGVVQQWMVAAVVVVERRVSRWLLDLLVPVPDDAHFSEVLVAHVPEMLVLVAVRSGVLVTVRGFAHVPVLVRHLAAVLVVVHHFAGVDQRYALTG